MRSLSITTALALSVFTIGAQENNKRLEFTGASVQWGIITTSDSYSNSLSDFKKLAPKSDILSTDFSSFNSNSGRYTVISGPTLNLGTYFSIKDKGGEGKRFNPILRVGINFFERELMSRNYDRKTNTRVDTLVSRQSGTEYYVDSVRSEFYDVGYSQSQLFLNASYLISSNPENQIMFYGGVTAAIGFSIRSSTHISSNEYSNTESEFAEYRNNTTTDNKYRNEYYDNKGSLTALLSAPIGIDLRVSMKNKFWSRVHLLLEFSPSLTYYSVPELNTNNISTASFVSTGFKFEF